jgi:hypothetical protein
VSVLLRFITPPPCEETRINRELPCPVFPAIKPI